MQRSSPGLVQRAVGAAVSAAAAVAAAVLPESVQAMLPAALKPSAFKSSPRSVPQRGRESCSRRCRLPPPLLPRRSCRSQPRR